MLMLKDLPRFWRFISVLAALAVCVLFGAPANAQLSDEELRRERIETIEQLKYSEEVFGSTTRAGSNLMDKYGVIMDYGGALSLSYTGGSNNDRSQGHDPGFLDSTDHNYDYEMNLFGSVQDKARLSKFYVRLKTKYTETKKSGTAGTVRGNDYEQANFDLVYFEKKIPTPKFQHQWTFGRQFISIGRGIAYASVGNGVLYSVRMPKGFLESYNLFMVRQNARDDNADVYNGTSDITAGRTKRQFYGMEIKFRYMPRHKAAIYWVMNDDKNTDSSPATGRHQYDSEYLGYGVDGPLPFVPNTTYFGEYIKVSGRSFGRRAVDMTLKRDIVDAYAYDIGLKYKFQKNRFAPTFNLQWSGASGDVDRITSAVGSSAVPAGVGAGNLSGTPDNAFTSFGGLSLGYALAPTFSNLRVFQMGGSIKPWKDVRALSAATLNLAYYKYWKDIASGPMSDPFAVGDDPRDDLGDEFNASVRWKILSDLKSDLRVGLFRPGELYGSTRTRETYIKYKFTVDL